MSPTLLVGYYEMMCVRVYSIWAAGITDICSLHLKCHVQPKSEVSNLLISKAWKVVFGDLKHNFRDFVVSISFKPSQDQVSDIKLCLSEFCADFSSLMSFTLVFPIIQRTFVWRNSHTWTLIVAVLSLTTYSWFFIHVTVTQSCF